MTAYDLIIVGAGPGGYVAAIRAAQLGIKTAIVEREEVGGVCLNWGCIPSKALLRNAEVVNLVRDAPAWGISVENPVYDMGAAIARSRDVVDRMVKGVKLLLKKNRVDLHSGIGRLSKQGEVTIEDTGAKLTAPNVVIATGARAKDLPNLPIDGKTVITSREALGLREPPGSVAIIGGGAVGIELAYFWHAYGVRVTIIEMLPHLLPLEDKEVSEQIEKAFKSRRIDFRTGSTVESLADVHGKARLVLSPGEETIEVDKVLIGVGVAPNTQGLGLEALGIETDRGFVRTNTSGGTNLPGVYAIGDVTGRMPLAHVASAQGVAVAETIGGGSPGPLDYGRMPRAVYCQPQVASMGLSEEAAIEQGHEVHVGRFPFAANGKAMAAGHPEGFAKIVSAARTGEILGAHLVGHDVTDLLAEISVTSVLEGTALEIGRTVHPHPTLSEVIMEAGLATSGEAINS